MNIKYFILIDLRNYFLNYILFIYLYACFMIKRCFRDLKSSLFFLNNFIITNRIVYFINQIL